MNTLKIALRVVRKDARLIIVAIGIGLATLATPLLPGARFGGDARAAAAIIAASLFGLIITVVLGTTMLARDIGRSELAFDLGLPLSEISLFLGRALGAWVLCIVCIGAILTPSGILDDWTLEIGKLELLGAVFGTLGLLMLVHWFAIALRARSAFLGVDLITLVTVASVLGFAVDSLIQHSATEVSGSVIGIGVATFALAIAVLAPLSFARERFDLAGNHRRLSLGLVAMIALLGATGVIATQRFNRSSIASMDKLRAVTYQNGISVFSGQHPNVPALFTWLRSPDGTLTDISGAYFSEIASSDDGRCAVWQQGESRELWMHNLDSGETSQIATVDADWGSMDLGPDCSRIALSSRGVIAAFELPGGRRIADAGQSKTWAIPVFDADGILHGFDTDRTTYPHALSWTRATATGAELVGRFDSTSTWHSLPTVDPERRTAMIRVSSEEDPSMVEDVLLDLVSGSVVAKFPIIEEASPPIAIGADRFFRYDGINLEVMTRSGLEMVDGPENAGILFVSSGHAGMRVDDTVVLVDLLNGTRTTTGLPARGQHNYSRVAGTPLLETDEGWFLLHVAEDGTWTLEAVS